MIRYRLVHSRLQVQVPYDADWVVEAHRLKGRYRSRTQMWSFYRQQYLDVAAAIHKVFGVKWPTPTAEKD